MKAMFVLAILMLSLLFSCATPDAKQAVSLGACTQGAPAWVTKPDNNCFTGEATYDMDGIRANPQAPTLIKSVAATDARNQHARGIATKVRAVINSYLRNVGQSLTAAEQETVFVDASKAVTDATVSDQPLEWWDSEVCPVRYAKVCPTGDKKQHLSTAYNAGAERLPESKKKVIMENYEKAMLELDQEVEKTQKEPTK